VGALALEVQRAGGGAAGAAGPAGRARGGPLALLTALAESAAALLAVELRARRAAARPRRAGALLTASIGPRRRRRRGGGAGARRDARCCGTSPGGPVDLRSPLQVKELLARVGFDLPDTRSWRLEPHAATSPAVGALLAWRKAERTATTYGWGWLDRHVGADGRLRGRVAGRRRRAGG
jgi:DNA polymerase-1